MIRRNISLMFSVLLSLLFLVNAAASPLDWYQEQENTSVEPENIYSSPQARLTLHEQKIYSPGFNAVVGRTMIPDGWTMEVEDLSITSESITCPNAIVLTVKSPDNSCELVFLSKRQFRQLYANMMGFEYMSEDDSYDYSEMCHTLNYRNAAGCCDYMAQVLFGGTADLIEDIGLTEEEQNQIHSAASQYAQSVNEAIQQAAGYGLQLGELSNTEVSLARRRYNNGKDIVMLASSSGYELTTSLMDTIFWEMPFIYGICADSVDQYMELFDVFCASTAVSQEYEMMRELNAERLSEEFLKAKNSDSSFYSSGSYDDIESSTVDNGDTYSAFDAWDDYIKDETDYTTGDGSHIKISSDYEHVFETDDGLIYAGNSADGPYGSTELNPTQIGY